MYWLTGIIGLFFAVAPFIFGYTDNTIAMWTSISLGGIIIVASWFEGVSKDTDRFEYWITALAGIGAVLAPFVFQYSGRTIAMITSIAVGISLAAIAGSKLFYDESSL